MVAPYTKLTSQLNSQLSTQKDTKQIVIKENKRIEEQKTLRQRKTRTKIFKLLVPLSTVYGKHDGKFVFHFHQHHNLICETFFFWANC